ncbi:MAG: tetratricopeptide repeat-containing protein [Ilumatobacteraceae bacterium]
MSDERTEQAPDDDLGQLLAAAEAEKDGGDMAAAAESFAAALAVIDDARGSGDNASEQRDYVVQQLALTTYKSGEPTEREALERGLEIIAQLHPETSDDTETLGIAGAMEKRLWTLLGDRTHLDRTIERYERGFQIGRDYYNGENYATALVQRAAVQDNDDDALADRTTARTVREQIVEGLDRDLAADDADQRDDLAWMHATMANCLFALGRQDAALEHERAFKALAGDVGWMLETYEDGKARVLAEQT